MTPEITPDDSFAKEIFQVFMPVSHRVKFPPGASLFLTAFGQMLAHGINEMSGNANFREWKGCAR